MNPELLGNIGQGMESVDWNNPFLLFLLGSLAICSGMLGVSIKNCVNNEKPTSFDTLAKVVPGLAMALGLGINSGLLGIPPEAHLVSYTILLIIGATALGSLVYDFSSKDTNE